MTTLVLVVTLLLPPLPGAKKDTQAGTATPQTATSAPAATTFDPAEIPVPVGTSTEIKAYLDVEGFEGKDLIRVTDVPPRKDDPIRVQFTGQRRVSTAQNIWELDLAIDKMPLESAVQRRAHLEFSGGETDSVSYVLSSRSKTFSWNVMTGPKELSYEPNDRFTINVTATGAKASNLRIATSSLQSSDGFAIDTDMLTLSPADKEIPDGTPVQYQVTFTTDKIPSGTYTGVVNFAIDESPDVKGVELTFNTSTRKARVAGVSLIFAGVALSLLIGVVLRTIVTNAEAMIPAAKLGEIATAHEKAIREKCKVASRAPDTLAQLQSIRRNLSEKNLRNQNFLRPWIANPFRAVSVSAEELTAYLQEQSDHLRAIGHLIENGLCVAARKTIDLKNPEQVAALDELFEDLDDLSEVKKVDELTPKIPALLAAFDAKIGLESPMELEAAAAVPTVQQLLFRVTVVSAFGWLIVLIVTVITGYAALIANDRGFGSSFDLLLCFLWGVGVQTAGQQLTSTTSSSVLGALGFTNPSPTA